MRKNKTIAYMLAATLLVGGTFAGTKAWFTDEKTVTNDLVITTGDMELQVDVTDDWKVLKADETEGDLNDNKDTEITNTGDNNEFTNVRPGDMFKKTVTVTNVGSLDQRISISGGEDKVTGENDIFEITTNYGDLKDLELAGTNNIGTKDKGESLTFDIIVKTIPENMKNDTHEAKTLDVLAQMEQIKITADQVNYTAE